MGDRKRLSYRWYLVATAAVLSTRQYIRVAAHASTSSSPLNLFASFSCLLIFPCYKLVYVTPQKHVHTYIKQPPMPSQSQRRGPWSQREDEMLRHLVETQGPLNWVRISQQINSRSPKQCRERYHQNLKPSLNHSPITPEEGAQIERMVDQIGRRWAEIARSLNNRSDNAVKNWWNGSMNRRKRMASHRKKTSGIHDDDEYDEEGGGRGTTLDGSVGQHPFYMPRPAPPPALTQLPLPLPPLHQQSLRQQPLYLSYHPLPLHSQSPHYATCPRRHDTTSPTIHRPHIPPWKHPDGLPSPSSTSSPRARILGKPLSSMLNLGSAYGTPPNRHVGHEALIKLPPLRPNSDLSTCRASHPEVGLFLPSASHDKPSLPPMLEHLARQAGMPVLNQLPTAPSSPQDHSPQPPLPQPPLTSTHGDIKNDTKTVMSLENIMS
ncbi:Homeodomain-like protein [Hypoxylon sp. NC1633]|nr:Homeodomain-like protein [Hypoxylon sp. NC1633]